MKLNPESYQICWKTCSNPNKSYCFVWEKLDRSPKSSYSSGHLEKLLLSWKEKSVQPNLPWAWHCAYAGTGPKKSFLSMSNIFAITDGNGHSTDLSCSVSGDGIFYDRCPNPPQSFSVCHCEHAFMITAKEGSKVCFQSKMLTEKQFIQLSVKLWDIYCFWFTTKTSRAYLLCRPQKHNVTSYFFCSNKWPYWWLELSPDRVI